MAGALKLCKKWKWNKIKRGVAKGLAEGIKTQEELAIEFKTTGTSISLWKREPEFIAYVDELTLTDERHTKAGILRRINEQQLKTKIGEKDWAKLEEMRIKMLGFDKQSIEHSGEISIALKWNEPDEGNNNPVHTTPRPKEIS